jgi:hypothetical protein
LVTAAAVGVECAIVLRTPAGRPPARKQSAMAQEQRGENSGDLRIAVLPAARAKATERMPRM